MQSSRRLRLRAQGIEKQGARRRVETASSHTGQSLSGAGGPHEEVLNNGSSPRAEVLPHQSSERAESLCNMVRTRHEPPTQIREREILENQQEITTLTVIWTRQLVSPQPKLGPVP